jgi:hypothetical protein
MKILEITQGLQLAISNEEADLLGRFSMDPSIPKSSLGDREQVIANQLVNKDVLRRYNQDGKIIYKKIS